MNSLQEPRISVIIPAYNNAGYIVEAVESVLNQTYQSYEAIVVDDGSTDETPGVLQPYHERIRYVFQENAGVCAARNHGLRLAGGEYIVFMDGDDVMLPEKLAQQAELLDNESTVGAVHSAWQLIDGKGALLGIVEPWRTAPKLTLKAWLLYKPVFLGSMMIRRNWLEQVGDFDTTLRQSEDVDLLLRLAVKGCRMTWLYTPTVSYRQHAHNTVKNGRIQAESLNSVLDKFFIRTDLSYQVRRLENRVRYYTLMWIVWHLYRTGYTDEIASYLRRTTMCTRFTPFLTVLYWIKELTHWCYLDHVEFTHLQDFEPHFKRAIEMDESSWQDVERLLQWWTTVWRYYLERQDDHAVQGLQRYKDASVDQLCLLAYWGEVISPIPTTGEEIKRFVHDARRHGMFPAPQMYKATSLYLTAFGQAIFSRRWLAALRAGGRILQYGLHPKALGAWRSFILSAFTYFWGRPERCLMNRLCAD